MMEDELSRVKRFRKMWLYFWVDPATCHGMKKAPSKAGGGVHAQASNF
uniref:Uncharacterized protein n=1 Tax=Pseudomonas monteilii TaxID=76759 RepID=A0A6B7PW17_9PSED|nr:hypothetical protein [Pseudomonas monteilii]